MLPSTLRRWPVFNDELDGARFQAFRTLLETCGEVPARGESSYGKHYEVLPPPKSRVPKGFAHARAHAKEKVVDNPLHTILDRVVPLSTLSDADKNKMAALAKDMLGQPRFLTPIASTCRKLATLDLLSVFKLEPDDDMVICSTATLHRIEKGMYPVHKLLPLNDRSRMFFCHVFEGEFTFDVLALSSDFIKDGMMRWLARARVKLGGKAPPQRGVAGRIEAGQSVLLVPQVHITVPAEGCTLLILPGTPYRRLSHVLGFRHWCSSLYWVEEAFAPDFSGHPLLGRVASHFVHYVSLPADGILCSPGEVLRTLYLVVSGQLAMERKMSLSGSPEEWVQIYSIGPGGMVGVEGVNLQQHMPYRARAIGPLSLLAMPFCNYVEMFEKKQGLPLKAAFTKHYEPEYSHDSIESAVKCGEDWGEWRKTVTRHSLDRNKTRNEPAALPSHDAHRPGDPMPMYERGPVDGPPASSKGWVPQAVTPAIPLPNRVDDGVKAVSWKDARALLPQHLQTSNKTSVQALGPKIPVDHLSVEERRAIYHPLLELHSSVTDPPLDMKIERVKKRAGRLRRSHCVLGSTEFSRVVERSQAQETLDVTAGMKLDQVCWKIAESLAALLGVESM